MKNKYLNTSAGKKIMIGLFCFLTLSIFAQPSQKIITYLNADMKPVSSEKKAVLLEERWKDKDQWKAKVLYADTRAVQADYGYADSTRNFKQGTYTEYGRNRKKVAQVTYNMGKFDGPYATWLADGTPILKGTAFGEVVYGEVELYEVTGKLKSKFTTDRNGNGTGVEYMVNTGVIGEGVIKNSKQHGLWLYKDKAGKKKMEVTYNDSGTIASETCFEADGTTIKSGTCISDKRPEFKGGPDAWRRFLEKNLKYPKEARKNGIQGVVVVKFVVQTDGTISNVKVIDSPDPLLSEEAERIITIAPSWEPGIECNTVIPYTHVQRVTFQLK